MYTKHFYNCSMFSVSMHIDDVPDVLYRLANTLGIEKRPDGSFSYKNLSEAPVVLCFTVYENELLLVKRSELVTGLRGRWHIVSGYLDEYNTLRYGALKELREEVTITEEHIKDMYSLPSFALTGEHKLLHMHPVVVDLKIKPDIVLNWENTAYAWTKKEDIEQYNTVPFIKSTLDALVNVRQ